MITSRPPTAMAILSSPADGNAYMCVIDGTTTPPEPWPGAGIAVNATVDASYWVVNGHDALTNERVMSALANGYVKATGGEPSTVAVIPVTDGGTGATNTVAARTNLGIGTIAVLNLNGNGTTYLNGTGTWTVPPVPARGALWRDHLDDGAVPCRVHASRSLGRAVRSHGAIAHHGRVGVARTRPRVVCFAGAYPRIESAHRGVALALIRHVGRRFTHARLGVGLGNAQAATVTTVTRSAARRAGSRMVPRSWTQAAA